MYKKKRRSKLRWLMKGVALFLTTCGLSIESSMATSVQPPDGPITLRIFAPVSTVCTGAVFKIEVDLRNNSTQPLNLWPQGISAIHFQTQRRRMGEPLSEYDSLDRQSNISEPSVAPIVLQPGASYKYFISLKDDFFKARGVYKVSVEYDGHQHQGVKTMPDAPPLFQGHLESNWLIFEVTGCSAESASAVRDEYDRPTGRTDHTSALDATTDTTVQFPMEVSLCELVSKCAQYDQKSVRVRAEFISDGFEYSALVDPSKCSKEIQPRTSRTVHQHRDIKALDVALTQGYRGTNDKQILGTFTGRYECGSASGTGGPLILQLQSVEGMIVKPRKVERSGRRMSSLKTDR